MPQSSAEKKDRFARIFPPRVQTLIKTLDLLENCTNTSNYEWSKDLVKRAWIEIGLKLADTCAHYDMDLDIKLNGQPLVDYDTTIPLDL